MEVSCSLCHSGEFGEGSLFEVDSDEGSFEAVFDFLKTVVPSGRDPSCHFNNLLVCCLDPVGNFRYLKVHVIEHVYGLFQVCVEAVGVGTENPFDRL